MYTLYRISPDARGTAKGLLAKRFPPERVGGAAVPAYARLQSRGRNSTPSDARPLLPHFRQRSCPSRSTRRVKPGRPGDSIAAAISAVCRHVLHLARITCQTRSSSRLHVRALFLSLGDFGRQEPLPYPAKSHETDDHRRRRGQADDDHQQRHRRRPSAGRVGR